jgi:hypothetical protein
LPVSLSQNSLRLPKNSHKLPKRNNANFEFLCRQPTNCSIPRLPGRACQLRGQHLSRRVHPCTNPANESRAS